MGMVSNLELTADSVGTKSGEGGRFACCTHLKSSHFERAAHLEPLVPSNNVTSSAGVYDSTEKEITHLFLGR